MQFQHLQHGVFGNTAECHIAVVLPVLGMQGDVRQQVDGSFKHIETVACADVVEAVVWIAAIYISLEAGSLGIEPSLVGMAGNAVFIVSHKYSVMVFLHTNPYLYQGVYEGNYHVIRGLPTSEVLFTLQSHEMKRIAKEKDCVFVGRCADVVLRDSDVQLLRVFVSAPEEQRVCRKMEQEGLALSSAKRLVAKMDKQRRKYYESYTGQKWGDPHNYDLNIDTGEVSISQAVDLIVSRF